jgi:type II secretory pathway pseudopilin PulG
MRFLDKHVILNRCLQNVRSASDRINMEQRLTRDLRILARSSKLTAYAKLSCKKGIRSPLTSLILKNQNGQSLIQVIISIGIMGILMMAMVSAQVMQTKENRALAEKLASLDLQRSTTQYLTNPASCSAMFAPSNLVDPIDLPTDMASVTPTNPYSITLKQLPSGGAGPPLATAGSQVSPLSNTLELLPNLGTTTGIQIKLTSLSATSATASLEFHLDQAKLVRPFKNPQFPINLMVSGATIAGCGGGVGSWVNLPPGAYLTNCPSCFYRWADGVTGDPMTICQNAGYATATGACRIQSIKVFGSVQTNWWAGIQGLGCISGVGWFGPDLQILCSN